MERKQNLKEPKDSPTGAAAKTARKQSGTEASTPPKQDASMNQQATGANGGEQDLMQHAKQAGGEIVNQVQERAGSQLAQGKDKAATDLSQIVQAVRRFGESLSGEQGGPIARYAAEYGDKAADSIERFSTYIREQDPKQLLNDVQNFGRRRPALLIGGAFLLGFAGARLIKSSIEAGAQHSYSPNPGRDALHTRPSTANVPPPRPATATGARPSTSPNAY